MKKAIKKITAVTTGALLLGSSLMGATAAELSDFPAPFVTNGVADVQFVIGSGATDDYLGVLDIATTLQAAAVSEEVVSTGGSGVTTEVEGGYLFDETSQTLVLGTGLDAVNGVLDKDDLPELLQDSSVIDDDREDEEYDYDQEIIFANNGVDVKFDRPDNDGFDDPVINLELDVASAFDLVIDFDDPLNVTHTSTLDGSGLNDGETILMFGKTFTFDSTTGPSENLILYGSEATTFVELNVPVTLESNDGTFTVEIVGADSDGDSNNIIVDVNGNRKTVEEGDSTTIGGLDVYIQDLFVTNIPTLSASANIFIGSEELEIPTNAVQTDGTCADADYKGFEVNGVDVDGVEVCILDGTSAGSDNWEAIEQMSFRVSPKDVEPDVEWLVEGEEFVPPVFNSFALQFDGPNVPLDSDSKEMLAFDVQGDVLEMTFTNEDGEMYTVEVAEIDGSDLEIAEDVSGVDFTATAFNISAGTEIVEDVIFFAQEGTGDSSVTKVYEVADIDTADNEVTFADLSEGGNSDIVVKAGKELDDTGLFVAGANATAENFFFVTQAGANTTTTDTIYTENDVMVRLTINEGAETLTVEIDEDIFDDINEDATPDSGQFVVDISGDGDLDINAATGFTASFVSDDDDDFEYAVTQLGTFISREADEEGDFMHFYIPSDEVVYTAYLAPTGASVTVSGGSDSVTTQRVNQIALGIAVKDVDVNIAAPAKNLIVVGGTCINSVSAALKGVAEGTCGTDSGLNPDEAIIELFDLDNGKVAMLIAGWEATETQAAARAVASESLSGKSATLTVTTADTYQIQ